MSPRLPWPRGGVRTRLPVVVVRRDSLHPEAADWVARVQANGSSVSAATADAVSAFCATLDANGLRSRFSRLSLLCGDNLLAAQIPLFRSTTFGGAVRGNSLDVNVNFVSGDYTQSSGLQCSGDSKVAALELAARPVSNLFPAGSDRQTGHMSATYVGATSDIRTVMGVSYAAGGYYIQPSTASARFNPWGTRILTRTATANLEHVILRRNSSGQHRLYVNGSAAATSTGASTTPDVDGRFVLGAQGDETPANNISGTFFGRVLSYSFGDSLDDTQASNYYAALTAFFAAIGRS